VASARDILINLLGKETVSPAAKRAGGALEDMGDDAKTTAKRVAQLDHEAGELKKGLAGLAAAWTAAGSAAERADLGKQINIDKAKLRKTLDMRRILAEVGEDGATGFSTAFVARLGPLLARAPVSLGGAGGAIGAGLAIGAVPVLGAAVAGAIIGGAGVGGVVGGLIIAAKHPAVKAEASSLGADVGRALERAAEPMVPATIDSLKIIRKKFHEAEDDISGIFAAAAEHAPVLAEGAGEGIKSVISGIRELVERADPVIDALADGFRDLGRAVEEGLGDLADNANEGARALQLTLAVVEGLATATFKVVDGLAEAYGWMDSVAGLLRGDPGPLIRNLYEDAYQAERSARDLTETQQGLIGGFHLTAEAANQAAEATRAYTDANRTLTDQNLSAAEATIRYKEAAEEARDAIDKKKEVTLDEQKALLSQARASNTLIESLDRQGASAAVLADKQRAARNEFIRTATQMGYSRQKAEELADSYFAVPRTVDTQFTADTDQAARNLRSIRDLIARIKSKRVVITTVNNQVTVRSEGRNVPIGDLGGREYGGPVKAGRAYVVGEKRPEVFVPDRDGRILPSIDRFKATQGTQSEGSAPAGISEERLTRALARALSGATFQIDDRRARLATVYARGG
jgi:hypothetical protein